MKLIRTERFKKAWGQLNEQEKRLAEKALRQMIMDLRYPSLGVKKMKGTEDIWEARASLSLRLTFQIQGDTIILRNIGHHDEALENP